jgi:hypothetical protein
MTAELAGLDELSSRLKFSLCLTISKTTPVNAAIGWRDESGN